MSNLAQNQLDFQVYNQQLNGPRSPIDMDTLKANAVAEQKEQAALGKVFDENHPHIRCQKSPYQHIVGRYRQGELTQTPIGHAA